MILGYALMLACGALSKFSDDLSDKNFNARRVLHYGSAVAYGLIAGWLVSAGQEFSTVVLAMAIGVLLGGKIDSRQHQAGIAALFASIAFFGIALPSIGLLAFFAAFAFLDEADWIAERAEKWKGFGMLGKHIAMVLEKRPFLEAAGLAVSIALWNPVYFLAILSFDIAYHSMGKAMGLAGGN